MQDEPTGEGAFKAELEIAKSTRTSVVGSLSGWPSHTNDPLTMVSQGYGAYRASTSF